MLFGGAPLYSLLFFLLIEQPVAFAGEKYDKATFAGGCFWCMEHPFEQLEGVLEVISGYTGGRKKNPTYEEVSSGLTDHLEAVEITYDPSRITYSRLLEVFWKQIDPTDSNGQFVDKGAQYGTAIFYHNEEQKIAAEKSRDALDNAGVYKKTIVTQIVEASPFYKAEDYHQDYYKKNPARYKFYRYRSGRDQYLKSIWSSLEVNEHFQKSTEKYRKPMKEELRKKLTLLQYRVTQENGTEKPFDNEYWNNEEEGIYVDIVSGEALFSSLDKYKSGTGWPSFTRPLEPDNIVELEDRSLFSVRTEVKSRKADSHLGHVFNDGPAPTKLRYCINSAALRFIPKEDLEKEGYGQYIKLLKK